MLMVLLLPTLPFPEEGIDISTFLIRGAFRYMGQPL